MVRNLERAEDIRPRPWRPASTWTWETFPEYLDAVDRQPKGINYAALHRPLGAAHLGDGRAGLRRERGHRRRPAAMERELRRRARRRRHRVHHIAAATHHETPDGRPVASRLAAWDEVERARRRRWATPAAACSRSPRSRRRARPIRRARAEYYGRLRALAVGHRRADDVRHHAPADPHRWQRPARPARRRRPPPAAGMWAQTHCRAHLGDAVVQDAAALRQAARVARGARAARSTSSARLLRDPDVRARLVEAAARGDYGRAVGAETRKPDYDCILVLDGPHAADPTRRRTWPSGRGRRPGRGDDRAGAGDRLRPVLRPGHEQRRPEDAAAQI